MGDSTKLIKIKEHIKRNKDKYVLGGICVVTGFGVGVGIGGLLIRGKENNSVANINTVKPFINIKSPITIANINTLAQRGHPGDIILCNETGELFASQQQAARNIGVHARTLYNHLNGKLPTIDGLTYTNLGKFDEQKIEWLKDSVDNKSVAKITRDIMREY